MQRHKHHTSRSGIQPEAKRRAEHDGHSILLRIVSSWVVFPLSAVLTLPVPAIFLTLGSLISLSFGPALGILGLLLWFVSAMLVTTAVSQWLYNRSSAGTAASRDREAHRIVEAVLAGTNPGEYFLYLRSFSIEDTQSAWFSQRPSVTDQVHATTFDDELGAALESVQVPLISVGNSDAMRVGAGRFSTTDSEWEALVLKLMAAARAIIICPAATRSLVHEIECIANDRLLSIKTILVMLPKSTQLFPTESWTNLRNQLASKSIEIPAYIPAGAFFDLRGFFVEFPPRFASREQLALSLLDALPATRAEKQQRDFLSLSKIPGFENRYGEVRGAVLVCQSRVSIPDRFRDGTYVFWVELQWQLKQSIFPNASEWQETHRICRLLSRAWEELSAALLTHVVVGIGCIRLNFYSQNEVASLPLDDADLDTTLTRLGCTARGELDREWTRAVRAGVGEA